ncbi:MAG TPA: ParA family protein, partial [Candidatus Hydrogenedentes bacterium]|nr:ParA family protein [Candidatus Hydrogenedentota bacterium]
IYMLRQHLASNGRSTVRPYDHMTRCHTIAIFNHKGGVGKTTTAVNLAASLAYRYGKRCLVVDMDPQANATRALLGKELDETQPTIRCVLAPNGATPCTLSDILIGTVVPNLILAPAALNLSEAEFKLATRTNRELILREHLRTVAPSFDYILIDCAPSLGLLALNGLAAATRVLIPCETQFLSLRGLRYVLDVFALVQSQLNPTLTVLGVLATKHYILSKANAEALHCLKNLKQVHVFDAVIPRDVKAEEAPSHGKPLVIYAPEARATKQYLELAQEVITLCRG